MQNAPHIWTHYNNLISANNLQKINNNLLCKILHPKNPTVNAINLELDEGSLMNVILYKGLSDRHKIR